MAMSMQRWMPAVIIGILMMASMAAVAAPRALSDSELDRVYAAGFDVTVDLGLDIAATNPDAVVVQMGNPSAALGLLNQGMTMTAHAAGSRDTNSGSLDPGGMYMPNLQNLVVNNINIAADALSNATTLMNVFALQGDVAIGVNLNVIVNPTNSTFDIHQSNYNWSTLNLSDAFKTLTF
ncbi:MAG TPA: hypothetical protein VGM23_15630 [Armatimonadota bacterium]